MTHRTKRQGGTLLVPTAGSGRRRQRPRERVLLVTHADGFLEAFAAAHVDVHIATRLRIEREDARRGAMLDEYTALMMPRCYRDLYWPGNLRATGLVRRRTVASEAERRLHLDLVRACEEGLLA